MKRKRDESHTLIKEYAKKLKSIPGDSAQLMEEVDSVRQEMQRSDNPFITSILAV